MIKIQLIKNFQHSPLYFSFSVKHSHKMKNGRSSVAQKKKK